MHEELESALNELEGPRRRAVEQVREAPVLQEAMERSLEHAGRLPMQNLRSRWSQHNVPFAGLVGLAATVLVAVVFWPNSKNEDLASAKATDHSIVMSVKMAEHDIAGDWLAPSTIEEKLGPGGKEEGKAADAMSQVQVIGNTVTKDSVIRRQALEHRLKLEPPGPQA